VKRRCLDKGSLPSEGPWCKCLTFHSVLSSIAIQTSNVVVRLNRHARIRARDEGNGKGKVALDSSAEITTRLLA